MNRITLILAAILTTAAGTALAQGKAHDHGTPPPCCETGTPAAYKTTGTVKKIDAAKLTATIAHPPIPELKWPAMTMAFKVKDKALLDRLAVEKKIDFSFVRDGKDYVITAVQ